MPATMTHAIQKGDMFNSSFIGRLSLSSNFGEGLFASVIGRSDKEIKIEINTNRPIDSIDPRLIKNCPEKSPK